MILVICRPSVSLSFRLCMKPWRISWKARRAEPLLKLEELVSLLLHLFGYMFCYHIYIYAAICCCLTSIIPLSVFNNWQMNPYDRSTAFGKRNTKNVRSLYNPFHQCDVFTFRLHFSLVLFVFWFHHSYWFRWIVLPEQGVQRVAWLPVYQRSHQRCVSQAVWFCHIWHEYLFFHLK